jgi:hypothetical protein
VRVSQTRWSRGRLAALGAVIAVLGGVACSAASQNLSTTSAPTAASTGKVAQPAAIPAAQAAPGGGGVAVGAPAAAPAVGVATDALQRSAAAPGASQAANTASTASTAVMEQSSQAAAQPLDRMVIRTAQLTVEVPDMEQALAAARAIAARGGGFVSASNTHVEKVNDQNRTVADLTIQVRTDAADSALSDLRALGKVTTESSGAQDVTEEYVDLDSNLRNLQASESAILKLMDKATRIEDVLALQRELTNVRGQIERIQGRKRFLERRTDMATITLALRLPAVEGAATPGSAAWNPISVAQRGWQASLAVLRGIADVFIVAAAFSWWLLPFGALAGYWLLHHRRRGAATPPPAAPAS